ncbi:MAG: YlzJ-like family protein [Syntrophomonadaceae bacterium]|jgi:hypothetical protein
MSYYYLPNPMEIFEQVQSETKYKDYRLPSGGIVSAELLPDSKIRIVSICSSDPMDYLNSAIAPGSIIELGIVNRQENL